ncbi:granulocyte-macrophage colony-stimulating factor receptor subunit alpha-like isoform X2 [Echeneis naucrates]|uniref:granulocyte-macrophage colony-stimulating factor receptor subunit alpha-like isoform X2 n=1 Tax=Echeneis naucrates TaxID=173247 RepID=UPI0011132E8C|nr:granulocyte-macrophage colony-stimulating factor receptor subunit alpha-like isoform X2 [Echeneis naucrates]
MISVCSCISLCLSFFVCVCKIPRLTMKLFFVHPEFWSSVLVLFAIQVTKGDEDICFEEKDEYIVTKEHENFTCILYPTNLLNCSWSLQGLEKDVQLSVYISICNHESIIPSLSQSSNARVDSRAFTVPNDDMSHVILQFNETLHSTKKSAIKSYTYEKSAIEVLSPPSHLSATIKDEDLSVTWTVPNNISGPDCFVYQLDLGDEVKTLDSKLSYTEPIADPTHTYKVRIRTRKGDICFGSAHWSEWSPTIMEAVNQSVYKLNTVLIISISLGIPMILVALMHQQRLLKILFPPIPRPPQKYRFFLEKNDTFTLSPPVPSSSDEEITMVDDVDQNTDKISIPQAPKLS